MATTIYTMLPISVIWHFHAFTPVATKEVTTGRPLLKKQRSHTVQAFCVCRVATLGPPIILPFLQLKARGTLPVPGLCQLPIPTSITGRPRFSLCPNHPYDP